MTAAGSSADHAATVRERLGGSPLWMGPSKDEALAALDALVAYAGRYRQERDAYATELHSLRWLLGLDTHEGEEAQSEDESVANLRGLLAGSDKP